MMKSFSIQYDSENKSFSLTDIIKGPDGINLKTNFKSPLARALLPKLIITCYKFYLPKNIFELEGEAKDREIKLINGLKSMYPNVPVIRATKFLNGCYIHNLTDDLEKLSNDPNIQEKYIRQLCDEWGMKYEEFKPNIKEHMIILGDKFYSACILAHELGHYLNTIGLGEPLGDKYHQKYDKAVKRANIATAGEVMGLDLSLAGTIFKSPIATNIGLDSMILSGILKSLLSRPILKSEKFATITGLKLLKKLDTTESETADHIHHLTDAYHTYTKSYRKYPIILTAIASAARATLILL